MFISFDDEARKQRECGQQPKELDEADDNGLEIVARTREGTGFCDASCR